MLDDVKFDNKLAIKEELVVFLKDFGEHCPNTRYFLEDEIDGYQQEIADLSN